MKCQQTGLRTFWQRLVLIFERFERIFFWVYHDATLRYCRSSLTVDGGSSSAMATTFSGSVPIPSLLTRWPRYNSSFLKNWHFSGLSLRSSFSRRNTSFRLALCSSSERQIRCHPGKQMRAATFRGWSVERSQTPNEVRMALLSTGISLSPAL